MSGTIKSWKVDTGGLEIPFTMVPNAILEDTRLSWRAKGLWSYLAGRPPGWRTNADLMAMAGTDGRDANREALKELERTGWLTRRTLRSPSGQNAGVEYILHPSPETESANLESGETSETFEKNAMDARSRNGKPGPGLPAPEDQGLDSRPHNKKDHQKGTIKKEGTTDPAFGQFLESFMEQWNLVAGEHGFPKMRSWTEKRRRAARARFQEEEFRESWEAAIWSLHESPFHMGDNQRRWKANAEWCLRPDKLINFYEAHQAEKSRQKAAGVAIREDDRQGEFTL